MLRTKITGSTHVLRTAFKRYSSTIDNGAVEVVKPKKTSFTRRLFRLGLAVTAFYAGGVAVSQYDDDLGTLFTEKVPGAEKLVDSYVTYRYDPTISKMLSTEYLLNLFKGENTEVKPSTSSRLVPIHDAIKELHLELLELDSENNSEPEMQKIINSLNSTINMINEQKLRIGGKKSRSIEENYKQLIEDILHLDKNLKETVSKSINEKTEEVVKKVREQYKRKLAVSEVELQDRYKNEFIHLKEEMEKHYQDILNQKLEANKQHLEAKHANEIALLSITQVSEFNKIIKEKVDSERNGRLAKIEDLDKKAENLTEALKHVNKVVTRNEAVKQIAQQIEIIRSKLNSHDLNSISLHDDLTRLRTLTDIAVPGPKPCCKHKDLTPSLFRVALDELESVAGSSESKILSEEQIYNRWNLLESDFKTASLLPPNAGMLGHFTAKLFSLFLFTKRGSALPDATDLDSVFARINENLRHSKLDKAVADVVTLKGWTHVLCDDWLKNARRKLEVEKLVDVLDSELKSL
ncbi:Mitochondrial inner membrane protein [Nakaseomyces glabratus]|nr:Mitochondrial inner membrane protein [Nakaseomyces glabratus]KAH7602448.1 Mitochondrial inner membrane protein [Nakaseomyces glabratus]KAH7613838.1 Mitochondrial inner membrane protein [Nakaseomyces glabratus]